jgi:hypothetical protein
MADRDVSKWADVVVTVFGDAKDVTLCISFNKLYISILFVLQCHKIKVKTAQRKK